MNPLMSHHVCKYMSKQVQCLNILILLYVCKALKIVSVAENEAVYITASISCTASVAVKPRPMF